MAIINKTGIGEGNLIEAEHITRIIDALTSVSTDTVSATGSFSGSFKGDGSQLTGITVTNATSASYAATASFLTGTISSASFASSASYLTGTVESASFAITASYVNPLNQNLIITGSLQTSGSRVRRYRVLNITDSDITPFGGQTITSTDDVILIVDETLSAPVPTECTIDITTFLNSTPGRCVEIVRIQTTGTGAGMVIGAATMTGAALMINNQSETNGNRAICSTVGDSVILMALGTPLTGSMWGVGY
jgi:hypothetical protein